MLGMRNFVAITEPVTGTRPMSPKTLERPHRTLQRGGHCHAEGIRSPYPSRDLKPAWFVALIALSGSRRCPLVHPRARCAARPRERPSLVDMRRVHDQAETGAPSRQIPVRRPDEAEQRPDAAGPPEALVESLQRSAGNTAVRELLARDRTPPSGPAAGDPVPPAVKRKAERKLGSDLTDVRVHTDAGAGAYARSVGAEAVTVGRDIFVDPASADVATSDGQKTLMHELVHAAQSSGQGESAPRGLSNPSGAAEREAAAISSAGLYGAISPTTQIAPAGVAHRKTADEEEQKPEPEKMPDLLNPQPLSEDEQKASGAPQPAKPGESGDAESVVYEITVMQPLRSALAAVEQQDWEGALDELGAIGMKLMDYQSAYEKRDPLLHAQLMAARGWLSVVYQQLNRRTDRGVWSDDAIARNMRDAVGDFQGLESKL